MRCRRLYILIWFVIAAAPWICSAKMDDPPWMREVTAAGQPQVALTLAASGRPQIFEKLTLKHQLRFDGVRYLSKVLIVELESRLIPKGAGRYEWRTPAGDIIVLNEANINAPQHNWRIVKNVGSAEIAIVGGIKEVYVYKRSRLTEYEKSGVRYFINLKEEVSEVKDKHGAVLIRLLANGTDSQKLSAFGPGITLHYGEDGELSRCSGDSSPEIEFSYTAGLLTGIRQDGVWRRFEWGTARYGKYEKPEKKIPPVIISNSRYKFEYISNSQTLAGAAYSDGTKIGAWNFSYKTGLYRVTFREEQKALSTNRPDSDSRASP